MGSASNDSISNGLCKQRVYLKWAPQRAIPYQMGSASNDSISNGLPKERFYIKWALYATILYIKWVLQATILYQMGSASNDSNPEEPKSKKYDVKANRRSQKAKHDLVKAKTSKPEDPKSKTN